MMPTTEPSLATTGIRWTFSYAMRAAAWAMLALSGSVKAIGIMNSLTFPRLGGSAWKPRSSRSSPEDSVPSWASSSSLVGDQLVRAASAAR